MAAGVAIGATLAAVVTNASADGVSPVGPGKITIGPGYVYRQFWYCPDGGSSMTGLTVSAGSNIVLMNQQSYPPLNGRGAGFGIDVINNSNTEYSWIDIEYSCTGAPSPTPTTTPTDSPSPTATNTPTPTDSPTPSDSPSPTDSPTPSDSPSPSDSPTPSDSPSPTDSPSPSGSPTSTPPPVVPPNRSLTVTASRRAPGLADTTFVFACPDGYQLLDPPQPTFSGASDMRFKNYGVLYYSDFAIDVVNFSPNSGDFTATYSCMPTSIPVPPGRPHPGDNMMLLSPYRLANGVVSAQIRADCPVNHPTFVRSSLQVVDVQGNPVEYNQGSPDSLHINVVSDGSGMVIEVSNPQSYDAPDGEGQGELTISGKYWCQ